MRDSSCVFLSLALDRYVEGSDIASGGCSVVDAVGGWFTWALIACSFSTCNWMAEWAARVPVGTWVGRTLQGEEAVEEVFWSVPTPWQDVAMSQPMVGKLADVSGAFQFLIFGQIPRCTYKNRHFVFHSSGRFLYFQVTWNKFKSMWFADRYSYLRTEVFTFVQLF